MSALGGHRPMRPPLPGSPWLPQEILGRGEKTGAALKEQVEQIERAIDERANAIMETLVAGRASGQASPATSPFPSG
ncbi:MAG: hypothetical protein KA142_05445 [Chromatiaceae bacterium]|nr:hypothetical protein [Chromatiaceae bacterium]